MSRLIRNISKAVPDISTIPNLRGALAKHPPLISRSNITAIDVVSENDVTFINAEDDLYKKKLSHRNELLQSLAYQQLADF